MLAGKGGYVSSQEGIHLTFPQTNSSHLKIRFPERKVYTFPTIIFQLAMLVLGSYMPCVCRFVVYHDLWWLLPGLLDAWRHLSAQLWWRNQCDGQCTENENIWKHDGDGWRRGYGTTKILVKSGELMKLKKYAVGMYLWKWNGTMESAGVNPSGSILQESKHMNHAK